jgi:hypothetical protein
MPTIVFFEGSSETPFLFVRTGRRQILRTGTLETAQVPGVAAGIVNEEIL